MLDETVDVKTRINKAKNEMRALEFNWDAKEVPIITETKVHQAILISVASWGSENWNGSKGDLAMMEVLCHKSVRRILVITMG